MRTYCKIFARKCPITESEVRCISPSFEILWLLYHFYPTDWHQVIIVQLHIKKHTFCLVPITQVITMQVACLITDGWMQTVETVMHCITAPGHTVYNPASCLKLRTLVFLSLRSAQEWPFVSVKFYSYVQGVGLVENSHESKCLITWLIDVSSCQIWYEGLIFGSL